jgi:hypothetical protein
MNNQHALLLVGSPRARGTSHSLGEALLEMLAARGWSTYQEQINPALRSTRRWDLLSDNLRKADLVVLAFPLYVDQLPGAVIAGLERIEQDLAAAPLASRPRFLAIGNCGFPEAHHIDPALEITRLYALQLGWEWAGGLALGGGEMIHGAPLAEAGGRALHLLQALELTAAALDQDQPVPQQAVDLFAKPVIPAFLYRWMGGFGWKQRARQLGTHTPLNHRPYLASK